MRRALRAAKDSEGEMTAKNAVFRTDGERTREIRSTLVAEYSRRGIPYIQLYVLRLVWHGSKGGAKVARDVEALRVEEALLKSESSDAPPAGQMLWDRNPWKRSTTSKIIGNEASWQTAFDTPGHVSYGSNSPL
jgi:hypothetical protein